MGNPFRRANLLYRSPHSFSLRRRGSNIGFWPSSAQNSLPERLQESPNTENVDITTEIRPDTRKFRFGIAPLPPPHNQIYSRFWYAFSLFLLEFHSVNPFNGNFCEPGRARFAEKKMEFPSQVVSKEYYTLFSAKIGPFTNSFRGRVSAVHDKRAEWTCSRNVLCSKMWNPPRIEVKTFWVST